MKSNDFSSLSDRREIEKKLINNTHTSHSELNQMFSHFDSYTFFDNRF